jgi:hypothetical protein
MRSSVGISFVIIGALSAAGPALGQTEFGAQASWSNDMDFAIGARMVSHIEALDALSPNLQFIGSGDLFFPGNGLNYFEINGNLAYLFEERGDDAPRPYLGAGLSFGRVSIDGLNASNSDLALNLLAGVQFPRGDGLTPFVEVKVEAGREEQLVVSGGVVF